jgi:hypothetical protein
VDASTAAVSKAADLAGFTAAFHGGGFHGGGFHGGFAGLQRLRRRARGPLVPWLAWPALRLVVGRSRTGVVVL